MNTYMELRRQTWTAALKLAAVLSVLAAIVAVAVSSVGHVSEIAIVLTVIVVAFAASWVQTGRIRRRHGATAGSVRFGPIATPTA